MSKEIKDNHVFTSFEVSQQLNQLESFKEFSSKYHDYYYEGNEIVSAEDSLFIKEHTPAITQSQAQKFFRDVYNIIIFVAPLIPDCKEYGYTIYSNNNKYENSLVFEESVIFTDSYEETLEIGIKESLKLIQDERQN